MSPRFGEKTNPENKVDALRQLLKLSQRQDATLRPTWVPKLTTLFAIGGLRDVLSDVLDAVPYLCFYNA